MKSKIVIILASATLAITGANLKASAFERHTPTLNFSEFTLNNTIGQQNIGGNQDVNKPKIDNQRRTCKSLKCVIKENIRIEPRSDMEQTYAKYRRRNTRRQIRG